MAVDGMKKRDIEGWMIKGDKYEKKFTIDEKAEAESNLNHLAGAHTGKRITHHGGLKIKEDGMGIFIFHMDKDLMDAIQVGEGRGIRRG